jgi:hypothetical protein
MVVGLNIFKEYFKDYQDNYLIIGGTACDILIEEAGFEPRATEDIDMVLIVEALTPDFTALFWKFIKDGNYEVKEFHEKKKNCYRFCKPEEKSFPKQIELFSKIPDAITHDGEFHLTPIPTIDGVSNLSAILLNDDYYNFTLEHSTIKDEVHFANSEAIICLKAFAYLDNKKRKESGETVRSIDISKHKYDIFRMVFLFPPDNKVELPDIIKSHLQEFTDTIKDDLPSQDIFIQNGFGKQDMGKIFEQLKTIFNLN